MEALITPDVLATRSSLSPTSEVAVRSAPNNGAEVPIDTLISLGVDTVFGCPGGAVLPLYDALFGRPRLRHVLVRHEQAAVHAAQGYARTAITRCCSAAVAADRPPTNGSTSETWMTGPMGTPSRRDYAARQTGDVAVRVQRRTGTRRHAESSNPQLHRHRGSTATDPTRRRR
jgi:hypothetical protein